MARQRIRLVFGGGRIGLMGILADAVLDAGGEAVGVIPRRLRNHDGAHDGVSTLMVVEGLQERKQRMIELSDAFAVLPGGIGTLDELFEVLSWRQLGYHRKPIVLVDAQGYWRPLMRLIDAVTESDFADPGTSRLLSVVESVGAVLPSLDETAATQPSAPARVR